MSKQNEKVKDIDEMPKGRKDIKEMLDRMAEMKDSPKSKLISSTKEIA